MKTVNSKATLSTRAEELLSSRDGARDVMKIVIRSQTCPKNARNASTALRSKSGMYILTERPKVSGRTKKLAQGV
ncbi:MULTISPECIES: hypothetical protein [unclassified Stenotrophomonas]|uniref:hypothetical protein n=1 Tax=unclassified Stenotrophomonas TaxID=196198 RepID=UPI002118E9B0|nr:MULTISPECIES: hypothetical protein [unclassified Stenotrophomonas]